MRRFATPVFPLIFVALITFSQCQKAFVINGGVVQQISAGTLKDSSGNCMPDIVMGTFYDGVTPGSDTAYVLVQVNVKDTGSYTISTDTQNGFYFFDSGFFSSTGINTIKLKPVGTPAAPQITNFNITFDTSTCAFSLNVQDSTGKGLGGGTDTGSIALNTWQFTDSTSGKTFSGPLVISKLLLGGFSVSGYVQSGTDTSFSINLLMGATIATGLYPTNSSGNSFQFLKMNDVVIFAANSITSPPVLTITVSSYNAATKIIYGTFGGEAYDININTVEITHGVFKAAVQ